MFCGDSKRICNCIKHVSATGKKITLNLWPGVSNRQSKKPFLSPHARVLQCGFSAPLCSCALSSLTNIVEFAPPK